MMYILENSVNGIHIEFSGVGLSLRQADINSRRSVKPSGHICFFSW